MSAITRGYKYCFILGEYLWPIGYDHDLDLRAPRSIPAPCRRFRRTAAPWPCDPRARCWSVGSLGRDLEKKNDSGPGTGRGLRWMGQRNPINHQFCMVETCWNPRNNGMFTIYQLQDFATIHGRWLRFKEKLIDSAIDVLLVGGDWNMNFIFPYIIYWESCWLVQHLGIILWLSIQLGVFIIPTDELTPSFFRGVAKNHQPDCHRFWFIFGMIQTFCCPCFLCAEIGHEFGHQK